MGQVAFGKLPSNKLNPILCSTDRVQFESEVERDKESVIRRSTCKPSDLQINVYQSSATPDSCCTAITMDYQLVPYRGGSKQCDYPVEYVTAPRPAEYFVPVDCRPPRPIRPTCEYLQPAPVCYSQPAPVQRSCGNEVEGFWVEEDTLYMPTETRGRQMGGGGGCMLDPGRGLVGEILQAVRQEMIPGRSCVQPQYRVVAPAPVPCRPKVITTYVDPCPPPPPPPPQPVQIPAIIYYDPCTGAVTGTAGAGAQSQIMSVAQGGMGGYQQPMFRNGRRMRSFMS